MTPEIQTERLRLVPYTAGMVTEVHVEWLNDPEVVKFSEQRHRKHTIESQHDYVNRFRGDGSHIWLIKLDAEDGGLFHIGTITAYVDTPNKVANMGILIGEKNLWGKGYGTEAWTAVMDWLFENGIRKVEAGCMSGNYGMINVCMSTMWPEGQIKRHFLFGGEETDLLLFGKFAP